MRGTLHSGDLVHQCFRTGKHTAGGSASAGMRGTVCGADITGGSLCETDRRGVDLLYAAGDVGRGDLPADDPF